MIGIPLAILVLLYLASRAVAAVYMMGWRAADRRAREALAKLERAPDLGAVVWRAMVAHAVEAGTLSPGAVVIDDLHVFHRLDEDEQRLIEGAARAAFHLLRIGHQPSSLAPSEPPAPPPPPDVPPAPLPAT